jgi:hypothetical protein
MAEGAGSASGDWVASKFIRDNRALKKQFPVSSCQFPVAAPKLLLLLETGNQQLETASPH